MKEFSNLCRVHNSLVHLNVVTLTFPLHGISSDWLLAVDSLLSDAPITVFQLYAIGDKPSTSPHMDRKFAESFTQKHRSHLKRFAVLRSVVTPEVLDVICSNCIALEDLFISINRVDLVSRSYGGLPNLT